jgi:hypothetical protein
MYHRGEAERSARAALINFNYHRSKEAGEQAEAAFVLYRVCQLRNHSTKMLMKTSGSCSREEGKNCARRVSGLKLQLCCCQSENKANKSA